MNERILEQTVVSAGPLQSLTPEELRLDSEPLTIDPRPKPVRAWVRFGSKPVLVDAVAVRWTADAVGVVFSIRETEYRAGSVAKIVKLEHAWRRLDGRNDDGFQVAPFPG